MDTRIEKLAKMLTGYSCSLKPGEKSSDRISGRRCKATGAKRLIREASSSQRKAFYHTERRFDSAGNSSWGR